MSPVKIASLTIQESEPFTLIGGPCVIENEELCFQVAETLLSLCKKFNMQLIFKASYDKANRSSKDSYRGPGLEKGLQILSKIKSQLSIPVTTDVHTREEAKEAGQVVDLLQIPAFLCRQTDLILEAARSCKAVSVKKGQFMAPWDMGNVVEKIVSEGCQNIILIERGTSFGYQNLVSDFRSIPMMKTFGYPVCYDATHSLQLPGALQKTTGGQREYLPFLSRAALVVGADALFIETHPDPKNAKSDAATQVPLDQMESLMSSFASLVALRKTWGPL
jgi:2-dehydro-3-deoxyphosphooctonate aldolase (KDO 8-P synthase)